MSLWCRRAGVAIGLLAPLLSQGQHYQSLNLNDLSAFKNPSANWTIKGSASADPFKEATLVATDGTGILVNHPDKHARSDLFTYLEHGDLTLNLDFMMPKGSNSGIYLQGRYEIQLFDSWGIKNPGIHDCGAIYERWDDSKPEGQKGYEGNAPRFNACKAPGLWQHLKILFRAPRFNTAGVKTENARIVRIELNGITLHENVVLTGPTRGSAFPNEAATGPLRIQGDHGAVAFRNIQYSTATLPEPTSNRQTSDPVDPIFLEVGNEPLVMRSFVDFRKNPTDQNKRITHAASVGFPAKISYSINLKSGNIFQVWKGGFLNATPMWHSRGDGSSRPNGAHLLTYDAPAFAQLNDPQAAWPDTLQSMDIFQPKGYELDKNRIPAFQYLVYGVAVTDRTVPENDGKALAREIKLNGKVNNLYFLVAAGTRIDKVTDQLYAVDDYEYYVDLGDAKDPLIRTSQHQQQLLLPVKSDTIKYSIVW